MWYDIILCNGYYHYRCKIWAINNIKTNIIPPHQTNNTTNNKNLIKFMQRQVEVCKSNGKRYNEDEKMFALSLWHTSPTCYRLLRSNFHYHQ